MIFHPPGLCVLVEEGEGILPLVVDCDAQLFSSNPSVSCLEGGLGRHCVFVVNHWVLKLLFADTLDGKFDCPIVFILDAVALCTDGNYFGTNVFDLE